mgnify:CR=1 FL=1
MDSIRYIQVIKNLLKDGFAHVFVGTFFNKAVAMISSVVVARIVDKTDYAYLTYSETLYGYLIIPWTRYVNSFIKGVFRQRNNI